MLRDRSPMDQRRAAPGVGGSNETSNMRSNEQQYTNRGFQFTEIEVADYPGEEPRTLQVQESSLATEHKVWLGQADGPGHGEPGRRFHLNEDEARQVRDALSRFLGEEPSVQPPTREQIAEAIRHSDWDTLGNWEAEPERIKDDYRKNADAVLALFPQPTRSADEHCTGGDDCTAPTHVHGCFADRGTCAHPDEHPPVSIAKHAYVDGRFGDDGICHATTDAGYPHRCYCPRGDRVHVTPPPATPEEGNRG
jgi:hypothetical protein